ncbi:sialic acid-binding Ig-like lectin 14 [Tenrec ecaudatus]|uniref:sialic acid-binding Ig-like lectin 14 n=1 Tax=Tenrec ecaudatus TaxID=94439 RepID=UPI003F5961E8
MLMLILLLLLLGTGSLAQNAVFILQVQGPVKVEEGLCVHVPCTVFYPSQDWNDSTPAYGYWFRDRDHVYKDAPVATNNPNRQVQENTRGRFHLLGNPQTHDCSLEIKDAQQRDTGAYFFRLERGPLVKYNFLDNLLYVRSHLLISLLDAPENLTLHAFQGNSPVPEVLNNATSLQVPEGQSLRLVCEADSNPPATLSWSRGSLTLSPSQPLNPGVLELPRVVPGDGGEFTCRAQYLLDSYEVSLSLVVSGISSARPCVSAEQGGTWPLVITLLRGAIMGAGFLLTYAITWIYYTRFRGSQGDKDAKSG